MKNYNISHVIIEGCDGVGKSTLLFGLQKKFNRIGPSFRDRGELSDFVYAKKFGRNIVSVNQCHLPFLYVLVVKKEEEIREQLCHRAKLHPEFEKDLEEELDAVLDQQEFINLLPEFAVDHNVLCCDLSGKTIEESIDFVYNEILKFMSKLPKDVANSTTHFILHSAAAKKNWRFYSISGQPYFNSKMAILDPDKHNGVYESVHDKTYPISLMFASEFEKYVKECDKFDNKVNILDNRITLNKIGIDLTEHTDDVFTAMQNYMDLLNNTSCVAYYTRYGYRHCVSPLLYMAAMANTVIFFDQALTHECEVLKQIYEHDPKLMEYVVFFSEKNLEEKKKAVFEDENIKKAILFAQKQWYLVCKTKFL